MKVEKHPGTLAEEEQRPPGRSLERRFSYEKREGAGPETEVIR